MHAEREVNVRHASKMDGVTPILFLPKEQEVSCSQEQDSRGQIAVMNPGHCLYSHREEGSAR